MTQPQTPEIYWISIKPITPGLPPFSFCNDQPTTLSGRQIDYLVAKISKQFDERFNLGFTTEVVAPRNGRFESDHFAVKGEFTISRKY